MKPCSKNCFFLTKDLNKPFLNNSETALMQYILKIFQPSSCLVYLTLKYVYNTNVTCAQLHNITQSMLKNKVVYKKPVKYAKIDHDIVVHYNPCSHLGQCNRNKNCGCYNNKTYCEITCNCECCDMCFEPCNCTKCDFDCRCYINGRECTIQCHQTTLNDTNILSHSNNFEESVRRDQTFYNLQRDKNIFYKTIDDDRQNKLPYNKDANCKQQHNTYQKIIDNNENKTKKQKTNDVSVKIYDCGNKSIMLHKQAKTYIGESFIAGFGLFANEDIKKENFVIEYVGELISHNEAERRGFFYDRKKVSYLFDLSIRDEEDYGTIDATRIGNSSRFINHSKKANVEARQMMVNGMLRMGFYAKRNIKTGEELFFDYKYDEKIKKIFNLKD